MCYRWKLKWRHDDAITCHVTLPQGSMMLSPISEKRNVQSGSNFAYTQTGMCYRWKLRGGASWWQNYVMWRHVKGCKVLSDQELEILVKAWADKAVQEQLAGTTRNIWVFIDLVGILSASGFDQMPGQCQDNLKNVRRKFVQLRSQNISNNKSNVTVIVSHWAPFCMSTTACAMSSG